MAMHASMMTLMGTLKVWPPPPRCDRGQGCGVQGHRGQAPAPTLPQGWPQPGQMVTLLSGSLCASHTLVSLGMSDFITFRVTEKPCCQWCAGNIGSWERFDGMNAQRLWPVSSFPTWNEGNWLSGARVSRILPHRLHPPTAPSHHTRLLVHHQ